jgi:hypothetical protein
LGDELDHGRGQIGIGIDGHALEGNGAGDDDKHGDHHDEEALLERELDDAMNHGGLWTEFSFSAAKNS